MIKADSMEKRGGTMFAKSAFVAASIGIVVFVPVYAGWTQDTGVIEMLYINDFDSMAIHLDNGFPNAIANHQCPASDGYWAGGITDKTLKAALIAAKATDEPIVVTIEGCTAGAGGWLKIMDVYFK
jgi:hypothetical protein